MVDIEVMVKRWYRSDLLIGWDERIGREREI